MDSGTNDGLTGVWGAAANDVFIVGGKSQWGLPGTILHYDGHSWQDMNNSQGYFLADIWGSSNNDVFAVGDAGTILHYNGASWQSMASGTWDSIMAIWGNSGSDVFTVESGLIRHYNGSAWLSMGSQTNEYLYGIWGSNGHDVFTVGSNGTILHYDGVSWQPMASETSEYLTGVWGSSGFDVFAVGSNGTVLRYNPPAELKANFSSGQPGSYFTLSGENFNPPGTVTIRVNGDVLGTVPSDATGKFKIILSTELADAGLYNVAATMNPSASTLLWLDPNAPYRTKEGEYPLFTVPGGIAYANIVFLPLVMK